MDFYSKLFTMTEEDDKSHFCSDEFLSRNRMNVISTLIANSKKLWDDAYCDNCYEDSTSANYSFSFETKKFLNYSQAFDLCVDSTKEKFNESVICVECQNDYQKLNNLYEEFKKADQKKICFDLEDKVRLQKKNEKKKIFLSKLFQQMNKTRREWSGVYKCYKGKRDSLTAFYSLSSTIIIIAVSFYSAVYIIGSKYPGNETLDEQEVVRIAPTENATSSRDATAPGPSSSSHNRAPGPPSSSHNRAAKKYKKSDRELIINDDSDDDILTSPNQNSTLISLNN